MGQSLVNIIPYQKKHLVWDFHILFHPFPAIFVKTLWVFSQNTPGLASLNGYKYEKMGYILIKAFPEAFPCRVARRGTHSEDIVR
jgi:hypothetical protein